MLFYIDLLMKNYTFNLFLHKNIYMKKIHFIGIGGISMSALAHLMKFNGYDVQGSDIEDTLITQKLSNLGIKVYIGHKANNIGVADTIVYNSAIKQDNPELMRAKELGLLIFERSKFLGMIATEYNKVISISGMHGKTTTVGMVAQALIGLKANPTVHIGGELSVIGGNLFIGGKNYFVTEACEYKRNFLTLPNFISVILNIEKDHMDYYSDIEDIKNAFTQFADNTSLGGAVVLNGDDNIVANIKPEKAKSITFGLSSNFDVYANHIKHKKGHYNFNVYIKNKKIGKLKLSIVGKHNVYNALATISVLYALGFKIKSAFKYISSFQGVKRRFELIGKYNGASVISDYAHHPTEIAAVIKTAKEITMGKIICVFQPHTYTRTRALLKEFGKCFIEADTVIIANVYAARENSITEGSSQILYNEVKKFTNNCLLIEDFSKIREKVCELVTKQDIILILGAGNINIIANEIL
jgi:UDP-N-acetylmuramate--alanine ligase